MSRDLLRTGQVWRITFDTAAADGGAEGFSTTIEEADFDVYKDLNVLQRTSTAGFTVSENFDTITGAHAIVIDLSNNTDAGFYSAGADLDVLFTPDETVDGQTLVKWLARGTLESVYQYALREFSEAMYTDHVVSQTMGNTLGLINLSDIYPAAATADMVAGELLVVKYEGGTYDGLTLVLRVTSYSVTNQLAGVERLNGAELPEQVAVGDKIWRVGQHTATDSAASPVASQAQASGIADNTNSILSRFAGMTSLTQWLGLLAGKQLGDTTARNELRATGAGSGGYDEQVDSLEAQRDLQGGTYAELTAPPGKDASIFDKMAWVFMVHMNKFRNTGTAQEVHNDAGAVLGTATVDESAAEVTRGKYV